MEIIDNFLSEKEFNNLNNLITGEFPWYVSPVVTCNYKSPIKGYEGTNKRKQLTHVFLNHKAKSIWLDSLNPLLDKLGVKHLYRAKANLTLGSKEKHIGGWHFDNEEIKDMKLAIFYFNTNNGFTLLEDGTEIHSVKNRIATFDNVLHTSISQTDTDERIVLNINYK